MRRTVAPAELELAKEGAPPPRREGHDKGTHQDEGHIDQHLDKLADGFAPLLHPLGLRVAHHGEQATCPPPGEQHDQKERHKDQVDQQRAKLHPGGRHLFEVELGFLVVLALCLLHLLAQLARAQPGAHHDRVRYESDRVEQAEQRLGKPAATRLFVARLVARAAQHGQRGAARAQRREEPGAAVATEPANQGGPTPRHR
mmetsp:Transcript_51806/g.143467  ORF Transcript_51806/g.143467 Transcript_51806/m.143467 type:complete len:200 (-) Transcript_51806:464-1063(-)